MVRNLPEPVAEFDGICGDANELFSNEPLNDSEEIWQTFEEHNL